MGARRRRESAEASRDDGAGEALSAACRLLESTSRGCVSVCAVRASAPERTKPRR
jgi:hypothetical protein